MDAARSGVWCVCCRTCAVEQPTLVEPRSRALGRPALDRPSDVLMTVVRGTIDLVGSLVSYLILLRQVDHNTPAPHDG
jgi:hypothetical protein